MNNVNYNKNNVINSTENNLFFRFFTCCPCQKNIMQHAKNCLTLSKRKTYWYIALEQLYPNATGLPMKMATSWRIVMAQGSWPTEVRGCLFLTYTKVPYEGKAAGPRGPLFPRIVQHCLCINRFRLSLDVEMTIPPFLQRKKNTTNKLYTAN